MSDASPQSSPPATQQQVNDTVKSIASNDEFTSEAWCKNGFTVFQYVHGTFRLTHESVIMTDEAGQGFFDIPYAEINKISIAPGSFNIKTASRKYFVTLYNLPKTRSMMASGGLFGLLGIIPGSRGIKNTFSYTPLSDQAGSIFKNHGVLTSTSTVNNQKKIMLFTLFGMIAFVALVLAIAGLTSWLES